MTGILLLNAIKVALYCLGPRRLSFLTLHLLLILVFLPLYLTWKPKFYVHLNGKFSHVAIESLEQAYQRVVILKQKV